MAILTVSVGLLVFLAVGLVLLLQWSTSRQILSDLGSRMGMTVAAGNDRLVIFNTMRQVRTPFGQQMGT